MRGDGGGVRVCLCVTASTYMYSRCTFMYVHVGVREVMWGRGGREGCMGVLDSTCRRGK